MAKDGPNWQGLLKWSLNHADGTQPSRILSEEERRWFVEAVQSQNDVIKRMKEITFVMQIPEQDLESQGVTSEDIEAMLDELQDHVSSIDYANDLHSVGGLVPLLGYLRNPHSNIRAKAAEVVSTIVQNNPRSQQMVMDANGLEPLLSNFTTDPDVTARTAALGAISSLIMNNKPGIAAFLLANGYEALGDALSSDSARFQRKALNLIHYLLQENHSDPDVVSELEFPRHLMDLASSNDEKVREAALECLLDLAQNRTRKTDSSLSEDEKLNQLLQDRIKAIDLMSPEDLDSAREEILLVDSLWNACYNEPSSLREKRLVGLSGEDTLAPDVAGKQFEPPLRALAA